MKLQDVDRTIRVQSSNVDLGDVLPEYARRSILQVASKYFGRLNAATVHFSREGAAYRCTVNIQMGALRMMSAEAENRNAYAAFRGSLEKVAKQLRRAKRELREDKAERIDKEGFLQGPTWMGREADYRGDRGASGIRHMFAPDIEQMRIEREHGSAYRIAAE